MAKVMDITDKLDFDGNPVIRIRDTEIEVNADAATMLKVLAVLSEKNDPGGTEVLKMYELMFGETERAKIDKMKLNFKDFTKLVFTAISLVKGDEDRLGEQ